MPAAQKTKIQSLAKHRKCLLPVCEPLRTAFPDGLRGLIFDCDGVLVDSKGANIGYYNRLLAEFGHPPMPESLIDYVQMSTAKQAFEALFSTGELYRLPDVMRRIPYRTFSLPLLRLEPGICELLQWLHEQGVRLAVHTNRSNGMWDVLDMFSLRDFFDPVMTVEDVAPKPSPEGALRILEKWGVPNTTVGFIGDSPTDAGAARNAGIPFVAYRNTSLDAAVHIEDFFTLRHILAHGAASMAD